MRVLLIILFILTIIFVITALVFLIAAIIKKKKKLLWGFVGFLGGVIVTIVITFFTGILYFTGLSFLRYTGLPLSSLRDGKVEMYDYNYQKIHYYTGDSKDGKRIKMDGLFDLWYNIHENPNSALITEPSGEMLVRDGPPYTFQLYFSEINSKVESIQFINCILINSMENNLLERDDFYIRNSMGRYQDYKQITENENDYALFWADDRVFYRNKRMLADAERQLKESVVYLEMSEDYEMREQVNGKDAFYLTKNEMAKIIETSRRDSIIGFRKIPIDFNNDEDIMIKGEITILMTDGETKTITFEEKYTREIEEGKMRNWFPPDTYDHQKE